MSELNSTKRTDIYTIDPRNVVIVENFNVRKEFALDELKEQIKLQGVLNPITVVPFKDEDGNEKYRLVDGERRVRATLAAIEEGAEIARIKAIFLPRNTKEEDLLIEQMMRNEGKNFTEYEQALMFQRFRDKFGYSQSEIAAKFGKPCTFTYGLAYRGAGQERITKEEAEEKLKHHSFGIGFYTIFWRQFEGEDVLNFTEYGENDLY